VFPRYLPLSSLGYLYVYIFHLTNPLPYEMKFVLSRSQYEFGDFVIFLIGPRFIGVVPQAHNTGPIFLWNILLRKISIA
jgi:hypothetical protein